MATVTFDDNSLLIDDQRVWLVSGSIHYFRVPSELWRDRLLKAKRAGLNCISTYVAWNFHEPIEGQWDMSGDRDVAEFVRLAGELGLYVIVRPGPYICGEWDFGGLPGWLTAKTGMTYRTNNAAFMHYFDKYFRQLLPKLAELQVTRGGNIILIQNENEYMVGDTPDGRAYVEFISQLFRRAGFEIPILTCNMFSGPELPERIECMNAWEGADRAMKRAHYLQPGAPLIMPEFWPGWFDSWGAADHETRDDEEVARRAMEIVGCGAQFNYYMFHGGTNFAFWGSHLVSAPDAYQTTSYDYDAPLAEGGGLTDKYYLTRLVNMLANHMGPYLAPAFMEDPGAWIHDGTDSRNLIGALGRWVFVTNNGQEDVMDVTISLPDGEKLLRISLEPFGAAAIPIDMALTPTVTLDYANCTPLGFFGRKVLVLHGPEGWPAEVSIEGKVLTGEIPEADDEPLIFECEELRVVLISSELAMRTWWVNETLVFGPTFVGETLADVVCKKSAKLYYLLDAEGLLTTKKLKPSTTSPRKTAPRLSAWRRVSVCSEPIDEADWKKLDRPRDVDRLGLHYGYVWYRVQVDQPRQVRKNLFLPDCADRATIFLNGARVGVWGAGADAKRRPMAATFKRGTNTLTILTDNLGRLNFSADIGERKGLYGHIHDASPLPARKFRINAEESFSRRIVPRHKAHLISRLEKSPVASAQCDISMRKVTPVHLSFSGLGFPVAVLCNDRPVGLFERGHGQITLQSELKTGRNVVKLLLWTSEVSAKLLTNFHFHQLNESVTQGGRWSFRPWMLPKEGGRVVGKNLPAWYASKFRYNPTGVPLFLHILAAKKGQVFLNGRNVGRFWTIGPQHYYYLPECWLQQQNELLLFTEGGENPSGSRLEYRPLGPFKQP
ncbi:hypothetical protein LCGC14_0203740 [marine sediment metagenome]|uniref:Uncharacterized protein n=1 Tax=marine sediment metagenome TaxID=412755 RepID=A0A0F9X241_9ZZZZ|nr:beta-galactosidase [Phycisphaerae bacterium]HDZ44254.1 beta-galactosidase [Phycisphaerae bacterium]